MTVLSRRTLNRTRLHRQWLLDRRRVDPLAAVRHLVALQAQASDAPYHQLWSRLDDVAADDISAVLLSGTVVRVALLRGTVHLVDAVDARGLRALLQPEQTRAAFRDSQSGRRLAGLDPAAVVAAGHRVLADGPLDNTALAAALAAELPGHDGADLAYLLRCLVPLVQQPPRGVWGRGGRLAYQDGSTSLPAGSMELAELIRRYLTAFGPATVRDFQSWAGLTRTAEVFDGLRHELVVRRDATGRDLFDLPELPLVDPDVPAPPRLLGPFDNLLLAYDDRSWIADEDTWRRLATPNGLIPGTVLLDGRVAGIWRPDLRRRRTATIGVELFADSSSADRASITAESERLLRLAAPGAEHSIAFV